MRPNDMPRPTAPDFGEENAMSDDLVERLRLVGRTFMPELMHGSANEIERLRAEVAATNAVMDRVNTSASFHVRRAESAERERDALREVAAEAERERDLWKSQVHDEIAANLAFRAAGGALQDEDMPTFCARIIAERDALRARIEGAPILTATRNGVVRTKPGAFRPGKRVALVPVDE